ncbi:MAG: sodium/proline symporter PutP [Myxococcales bacterium]|nr:sodium/proline symporter PutP [Myxococcales bacterium]
MLVIGIRFYHSTDSLSDYILGGRGLNAPVTALSAGASDMSGWLILGLPGALYAGGASNVWMAVGLVIGAYLNWLFVAPRLRVATERSNDALTLPDYMEYHFSDRSRILRIVSALVILVFFTIYTSAGLVSGALLFEATFHFDYHVALCSGAAVIVAYTFLGGFNAVSWTDFFQGILMLIALLVVPGLLFSMLGVGQVAHNLTRTVWFEKGTLGTISLMAWGLGYFGQPHILVRFMSLRHVSDMPMARRIGMGWMILCLVGAMSTGWLGQVYFANAPLIEPEKVFLVLAQVLFNPWVTGLLLAAVLAAIMSTVSAQLLVCAATVTEDFYHAFIHRDASQRELVWLGRGAVLTIASIALLLGLDPKSKVLDLVAYAWAGFGASFGPAILCMLLWKQTTRVGVLVGIVVGATTVVVWKQLHGGIFDLYELAPGFVLSGLSIIAIGVIESASSSGGRL